MRNTKHRYRTRYQENLQKERGLMVTCDICTELISKPDKIFKNQNRCAHPICVNCIIRYINAKLDSNMSGIKCPALNCTHHLDPLFCRPIIPSLVFDKWCDLLCKSAVLKIDRCYCPNRECSVLILNECGGSRSKSKCPKCKKLFCFTCQVAWHAGYGCKEARKLGDIEWHDVASGVLAEKNKWKRCPTCHHCVERISGCNYVKCRCGTAFCYGCGRNLKTHPCECQRRNRGAPDAYLADVLFFVFLFAVGFIVFQVTRFCLV